MKNRNIVVLGQQNWESTIGSNNINIAKEFAKHNKVLYVDQALDRKTLSRHKHDPLVQKKLGFVRQGRIGLEKVQENLWVLYPSTILESINWLPEGFLYEIANKVNNGRLAKNILQAIKELDFKEVVVFNDGLISKGVHLKKFIKPSLYIYYSRDNFSSQPYFQKHAVREEREIMAQSDLVLANSAQLTEIAKESNPKSYDIGQGCDLSLYNPSTSVAQELEKIPKPIIGYTGFLTSIRLDIELLVHIATARPHWSIVLIGPEDDAFKTSHLHKMANVHFLGNRKPEELDTYIQGFDVAINPQLVNDLTRGNYPRKIDEYLAMGKPVVATKTDFMQYFEGYCYLATDAPSYVSLLEKALEVDTPELHKNRISFAHTHSWEKNVEKIYELVKGR